MHLVRRDGPVPAGLMPVVTAMAAALVRQGHTAPLCAGIALTGLGTTWRTTSPWWPMLTALAVIALVAVAIPLISRDARLARRWLDAHPQPATSRITDPWPTSPRGVRDIDRRAAAGATHHRRTGGLIAGGTARGRPPRFARRCARPRDPRATGR